MLFSQIWCTVCISSHKQDTCLANCNSFSLRIDIRAAEAALRIAMSFLLILNHVPLATEWETAAAQCHASQVVLENPIEE